MNKRLFAIISAVLLCVSLLAACGKTKEGPITEAEAQKIALESAGLVISQVSDLHTHVITQDGQACFQVHMTTDSGEVTVVINATTGEVVSNG